MTPRWADLKARKDRILAITIGQYIDTITPVSSSFIAKTYNLDLSSATIRNILAELEEEGYLTHPHTSAGRMPTQKGYRYYVDHLMTEIKLLEDVKQRIKEEYEKESKQLEDLLEKMSQVLSDMTHYTSIISVDGWTNKIFCKGTSFIVGYPDYPDIEKIRCILAALEEKELMLEIINQRLENKISIFIGQELSCRGINNCSMVISSYQLKDGSSGRIAVLGPTRMQYQKVVSTLNYLSEVMEDLL